MTYKDEMSVEKCLVMQHSLNGRTVELKRAIRKEDMAPGPTNTYGAGPSGGSGGPVRSGKQPDWTCPDCKNKNFGWREICNRCGVRPFPGRTLPAPSPYVPAVELAKVQSFSFGMLRQAPRGTSLHWVLL